LEKRSCLNRWDWARIDKERWLGVGGHEERGWKRDGILKEGKRLRRARRSFSAPQIREAVGTLLLPLDSIILTLVLCDSDIVEETAKATEEAKKKKPSIEDMKTETKIVPSPVETKEEPTKPSLLLLRSPMM
jgi:hypothetical protein